MMPASAMKPNIDGALEAAPGCSDKQRDGVACCQSQTLACNGAPVR